MEFIAIKIDNPSGRQFHGNNYDLEDSLVGVEHAHKGGYHSIDLDLNRTSDGVLFAAHGGGLYKKSWSQIENLNTHRKYKVSKLSDLMAKTAEYGLQINLDIRMHSPWNDASFAEIANLANSLKAKVTVKASTAHKELANALPIAQKHGFWVRSNKNPYAGNGWKAGVWHKPTATSASSSTTPTATPSDSSTGSSTGSTGNVRIGTYNAAGVTMQGGGLGGLGSAQRHFNSGMKVEEENNATIVTVQEAAKGLKAPSGWSIYFRKFGNRTVAILWKSSVWHATAKDILNVDNSKEPRTPNTYFYPYVTLADRNGNEITVMSIHLVSSRRNSPQRPEQAATVKQKALELAQSGKHVVVAGDFNYKQPALFNDMNPLTPASKSYKGIDHFFGTSGVSFSNWKIDKDTRSFTDHPLTFTNVSVSDTLYNEETPSVCTCPGPDASTSSVSLTGSDNLEKTFNYLTGKGLSKEQAAGAVGNIAIEGGDPTVIQGGKGDLKQDGTKPLVKDGKHTLDPSNLTAKAHAYGLIQWDPGAKLIGLLDKAKITDKIYLLSTQLQMVWWHVNNVTPTGRTNFIDRYKKIKTVGEATTLWQKEMEGTTSGSVDRKIAANLAFGNYTGQSSVSPASTISATTSGCSANVSGASAGNIVQTALNYAWHDRNVSPPTKAKPTYAAAIAKAKSDGKYTGASCSTGSSDDGADCGAFITRVMQDSGVDPNYGGGGATAATAVQLKYLQSHPELYEERHPSSTNDLEPGDIAIQHNSSIHHTYMYVGNQDGFDTTIASASQCKHAPWAGLDKPADPAYHWFRYIGSGGSVDV